MSTVSFQVRLPGWVGTPYGCVSGGKDGPVQANGPGTSPSAGNTTSHNIVMQVHGLCHLACLKDGGLAQSHRCGREACTWSKREDGRVRESNCRYERIRGYVGCVLQDARILREQGGQMGRSQRGGRERERGCQNPKERNALKAPALCQVCWWQSPFGRYIGPP
jgi:hypothetical protein